MPKKCEYCGKLFEPEQPYFRFCSRNCAEQARSAAPRPGSSSGAGDTALPAGYLRGGYFAVEGGKKVLRPEYVDQWAQHVAKMLCEAGVTSGQLRLFFRGIQGIRARMEAGLSFEEVKPTLLGLKALVAAQVGRRVTKPQLKEFIDANVQEAAKSADDFCRGFFVHFQTILHYYVYYSRGR